jgi:outer membrane protein OmpA-like peptidoglycan-associated protein
MLSLSLIAVGLAAARPAEAQLTRRVLERVKMKTEERKLQTEESLVSRAAEPADSALAKVAAPVETLAARVGEGAGAAVGGLGRGPDAAQEAARLREQLASGRAEVEGIRFQPGTPTLDPASDPSLRALAMALTDSPGVFVIRARPDPGAAGREAAALGEARAAAVKAWLVANGGPAERVFATGDVAPPEGLSLVSVTSMQ